MFDESRLDPLRAHVAGKRIAVLGSAPGAHVMPTDCEFIASVNASHVPFGLSHVDLHVLNSVAQAGKMPVHEKVREGLPSISCLFSIYIDVSDVFRPPTNWTGMQFVFTGGEERAALYQWASARPVAATDRGKLVNSTGVITALILQRLGAVPVLAGFSLADGHALHLDAKRTHTDMDAPILKAFGISDAP